MLNTVAYGNPNRVMLPYLHTENYLDSLLSELINYPYPSIDSEAAQNEIMDLIPITENLAIESELQERFQLYDTNFERYIVNVLSNTARVSKSDIEKIISEIHNDIVPLIVKLQYHYQRVRPAQLAYHFNMPLHSFKSVSSDSPSYPSAHAFQSKIYCEVLGNRFPAYYKSLQALAADISISRVSLGLNYPSDVEFAAYVADVVVNHPEFRKKYRL